MPFFPLKLVRNFSELSFTGNDCRTIVIMHSDVNIVRRFNFDKLPWVTIRQLQTVFVNNIDHSTSCSVRIPLRRCNVVLQYTASSFEKESFRSTTSRRVGFGSEIIILFRTLCTVRPFPLPVKRNTMLASPNPRSSQSQSISFLSRSHQKWSSPKFGICYKGIVSGDSNIFNVLYCYRIFFRIGTPEPG